MRQRGISYGNIQNNSIVQGLVCEVLVTILITNVLKLDEEQDDQEQKASFSRKCE